MVVMPESTCLSKEADRREGNVSRLAHVVSFSIRIRDQHGQLIPDTNQSTHRIVSSVRFRVELTYRFRFLA
jgi:hypothetical protein